MATTAGCESSPPPPKRARTADDYAETGENLAQLKFESGPQILGPKNQQLGKVLNLN